jgi:hypothetical protein
MSLLAHRVTSRQRSNLVAFGVWERQRAATQNQLYEYVPWIEHPNIFSIGCGPHAFRSNRQPTSDLPRGHCGAFHPVVRVSWDELSTKEDPDFYFEPTKEAIFARRLKAILERYGHISGFRSPLFDPALQKDPDRLEQIFNSTVRHWPYWH